MAEETSLDQPSNNRVLEFGENHPYVLLGIICVLVIVILFLWFRSPPVREPAAGKKKSKKSLPNDDETENKIDELITDIEKKQKE